MFHLINKAWVDILARQLRDKKIKEAFCVTTNNKEIDIITKVVEKYGVETKMMILSVDMVKIAMNSKIKFMDFDDILISHNLNDIYVRDFLAKHCKRINKNLK